MEKATAKESADRRRIKELRAIVDGLMATGRFDRKASLEFLLRADRDRENHPIPPQPK